MLNSLFRSLQQAYRAYHQNRHAIKAAGAAVKFGQRVGIPFAYNRMSEMDDYLENLKSKTNPLLDKETIEKLQESISEGQRGIKKMYK